MADQPIAVEIFCLAGVAKKSLLVHTLNACRVCRFVFYVLCFFSSLSRLYLPLCFPRGFTIASVWWWHCLVFSSYVTPPSHLYPLSPLAPRLSAHVWWISTNVSLKAITRGEVWRLKMKSYSWRCEGIQSEAYMKCSRRSSYFHASKESLFSNAGCYFGKKRSGTCSAEDNLQVKQQSADWAEPSARKV